VTLTGPRSTLSTTNAGLAWCDHSVVGVRFGLATIRSPMVRGVTINQALTITRATVEGVRHDDGTLVLGSGQLGFTSSGLVNSESIGSVRWRQRRLRLNATTVQTLVGGSRRRRRRAGVHRVELHDHYDPGNVMITAAPLTITAIDQSRTMSDGGTLVLVRG